MRKEAVNAVFFFLVLTILLVLSFLIVWPILDFVLFGFLLAIGFWPLRQAIRRGVRSDGWAAFFTLLVVALVAVLPMVLVTVTLLDDVQAFAAKLEPNDLEGSVRAALHLPETGRGAAVADLVVAEILEFLHSFTEDLAEVVARMAIGLMVLGFVLFYGFAEGPRFVERIKQWLPLKSVYKERLVAETRSAVHAIFFGQILVSIVHGIVLGIGFWLFGLPNPVLWGFLAIIISILPAIGTPAVWLPAGLYVVFFVDPTNGILLMVWSGVLSTGIIEHWWKLRVIGRMAHIHPLVVLVGVIGGIGVFGLSGFIFGPLILALLIVFTRVFSESYDEDPNYVFL